MRNGLVKSSNSFDKLAYKRSAEIDKQLKEDATELKKQIEKNSRIILLGTGDSGKTTVLRQLTLIHGAGFSDNEKEIYRLKLRLSRRAIWKGTRESFARTCKAIECKGLVEQLCIKVNTFNCRKN
jgi:ABC-type Fe3+/spermidine/putrescine transport system ATPase subunit